MNDIPRAVSWSDGKLTLLDQRKLPGSEEYLTCESNPCPSNSTCVDVNDMGFNRCTPLHLAAEGGHVELVELLLSKKAETEKRTANGDTALRVWKRTACYEILSIYPSDHVTRCSTEPRSVFVYRSSCSGSVWKSWFLRRYFTVESEAFRYTSD